MGTAGRVCECKYSQMESLFTGACVTGACVSYRRLFTTVQMLQHKAINLNKIMKLVWLEQGVGKYGYLQLRIGACMCLNTCMCSYN